MLDAIVLGLHLGTWHTSPGHNNVNPGVYLATQDYVAGLYRNSDRQPSAYLGRMYQTADRRWALTVGLISGYDTPVVIVPSVKLASFRLSALPGPKVLAGVHIAYEIDL